MADAGRLHAGDITAHSYLNLLGHDGLIRPEFLVHAPFPSSDTEGLVTSNLLIQALGAFLAREVAPLRERLDAAETAAASRVRSLDSVDGERLVIGARTREVFIGGHPEGTLIRIGMGAHDRSLLSGQISSTATFQGNDHVLGSQTVDGASVLRGPLTVGAATSLASLRLENLSLAAAAAATTASTSPTIAGTLVIDTLGNVLRSSSPTPDTVIPPVLAVARMTEKTFYVLPEHCVLYADPATNKEPDIEQVVLPVPNTCPTGRTLYVTNHNRSDTALTLVCADHGQPCLKVTGRDPIARFALTPNACIQLVNDGRWWRRIA
jgi:hypothetical protein